MSLLEWTATIGGLLVLAFGALLLLVIVGGGRGLREYEDGEIPPDYEGGYDGGRTDRELR